MVQRAAMSWDQWRTVPRIVTQSADSFLFLILLVQHLAATYGEAVMSGQRMNERGHRLPCDELGRQFLRVLTSLMEHSSSTTNHLFFLISCFPPRDSNWLLSVWWIRLRLSWPDSVKRAVQFVSQLCFHLFMFRENFFISLGHLFMHVTILVCFAVVLYLSEINAGLCYQQLKNISLNFCKMWVYMVG